MKNIYNKGWYRSREWAKHLRPFLKQVGNARWRKTADNLIAQELADDYGVAPVAMKLGRRASSKIVIKIKSDHRGFKRSRIVKYSSMRAARDAMQRNGITATTIIRSQVG